MQIDIVVRSAISDELEVLSLLIKEYELIDYPLSYPILATLNGAVCFKLMIFCFSYTYHYSI